MKISIIIPIYNIENYLPRCLSCIDQLEFEEFETILVDDGSTDKSGLICNTYSNNHENCTVIHKANGGVSSARNAGLKIAKGEYICFVDGDDVFDPSLLKILYNNAIRSGAEISCCSLLFTSLDGTQHKSKAIETKFIWSAEMAAKNFFCNSFAKEILYGPYNKIIRSDIAKQCSFREDLAIGEDLLYIFECIANSTLIYGEDIPLYQYIKRPSSATTTRFNIKRYDYLKASELITECCCNVFPHIANYAKLFLYTNKLNFCRDIATCKERSAYSSIFSCLVNDLRLLRNSVWNELTLKQKINYHFINIYYKLSK